MTTLKIIYVTIDFKFLSFVVKTSTTSGLKFKKDMKKSVEKKVN